MLTCLMREVVTLLKIVGYASSVPVFFGKEHVENVIHVVFQQFVAEHDAISSTSKGKRLNELRLFFFENFFH